MLLPLAGAGQPAPRGEDEVQEGLRNRIEAAAASPGTLSVAGQRIHAATALPAFYEQRTYRPAWSDGQRPHGPAGALLQAIRSAEQEGLRSDDYHRAAIEQRLRVRPAGQARNWSSAELIELDLLMTDAYLILASHLLTGRVDPVELDPLWIANRRERDLVAHLDTALARGRVAESLTELLPDYSGYRRLREELARHRAVAARGDWPTVSDGPRLVRGDQGPRVQALRHRLAAVTELPAKGDVFDAALETAVVAFQRRHGLEPDGVVGPGTLSALNVSAAERARQIALNMERWRWLPQDLGDRHIIVNIANFELDVVENGAQVLTMRVVAGRAYRRTPVLSDLMTYLVLNPYWHVPRNLAVQDILPQIKSDPSYLQRQGMTVFRGGTQAVVDPATIDWSAIDARSFDFRLRQDPGPNNALGAVKFMFPNRFNVYLHDTPSRTLFAKAARDFSSGCIRLERPLDLAEYLLREAPGWTRERLQSIIDGRTEQTVPLPRPIPVHLLYWTAWAEPDGTIQFRRDVYGRDTVLAEALREPPPAP